MKKILFTLLLISNYGFSQCVIDGTTVTGTTKAKVVKSCDVVVQSLSNGIVKSSGDSLKTATNADLPVMTATVGGAVPTPPNNTTTFLRGDGTFAIPSGSAPSDAAYGVGWDGITTVAPSKNSVYDKVETLVSKTTGTVLFANPSSSVLNITSDNGALAKSLVSIDNSAMTVGYNLAGGGSYLQMDASGAILQSSGTGINIQNSGAPILLSSDNGVGVVAQYLSLQTTGSVASFKATNVTAPIDIECQDASGTIAYLTDIPTVSGVYLPLAGGTMTGNIVCGGSIDMQYYPIENVQQITNLLGDIELIPSDRVLLSGRSGIVAHPTRVANYHFPYTNILNDSLLTIASAATLTNKTISGVSNTLTNIAQSSVTNLTSDLAAKQTALVIESNGTDADYTAVVNTIKYLPASTLTATRTITIPAGANGNILEIYNNESAYVWALAGDPVYLADRTTVVTQLFYNVPTFFKYIAGKWIITN